MATKKDNTFARVGALWKGRDKNDNPMLTGGFTVGQLKDFLDGIDFDSMDTEARLSVIVLVNNKKTSEKHPDFNVFLVDPNRDEKPKKETKKATPKKKELTLD